MMVDSTAIYRPGDFPEVDLAFAVAFTYEFTVCNSSRFMDFMQDTACLQHITVLPPV